MGTAVGLSADWKTESLSGSVAGKQRRFVEDLCINPIVIVMWPWVGSFLHGVAEGQTGFHPSRHSFLSLEGQLSQTHQHPHLAAALGLEQRQVKQQPSPQLRALQTRERLGGRRPTWMKVHAENQMFRETSFHCLAAHHCPSQLSPISCPTRIRPWTCEKVT